MLGKKTKVTETIQTKLELPHHKNFYFSLVYTDSKLTSVTLSKKTKPSLKGERYWWYVVTPENYLKIQEIAVNLTSGQEALSKLLDEIPVKTEADLTAVIANPDLKIVGWSSYCHLVFDADENILPHYTFVDLGNKQWNHKGLVAHLKTLPNVRNINSQANSCYQNHCITGDKDIVFEAKLDAAALAQAVVEAKKNSYQFYTSTIKHYLGWLGGPRPGQYDPLVISPFFKPEEDDD